MAEERKQPELRFKGFTDDWIQCELGELVVQKKSYSLSRSVEVDEETGYKYIHYGDIHTNKVNLVSDDSILPNIGPGDYELLEKNDLILADASEDYEGIAWPSVIICTPLNKIVAGLHTIVLRPHRISSIFLYYHIHTLTFRKFGSKVGTGMKVFGITAKNLLKYKLYIPTFDEQIKIEKTLLLLDSIITLEQKKIEKLELLKQYLLQNMFADKSGYPKIRFTNFNNEWSQDKLEDVADVRDGTHDSPKYLSEGVPLITSKNVGNGKINYNDINYISLDDYKKINNRSKVDINDILMGMIGTIGNLALIHTEPAFAIKNVALIKDTQQIFYLFLYYYLHCPFITKQLRINLDGGTQKFISLKKIRNLLIRTTNSVEQEKIGNCFNTLDSLITLEKTKLDKIQILKQKFLSSLFI